MFGLRVVNDHLLPHILIIYTLRSSPLAFAIELGHHLHLWLRLGLILTIIELLQQLKYFVLNLLSLMLSGLPLASNFLLCRALSVVKSGTVSLRIREQGLLPL